MQLTIPDSSAYEVQSAGRSINVFQLILYSGFLDIYTSYGFYIHLWLPVVCIKSVLLLLYIVKLSIAEAYHFRIA